MITRSVQTTPPVRRPLPLFGLIGGFVLLLLINVILSSQLASIGLALAVSQQQSAQLDVATSVLRQELVRSTSLADLDQHATALGFAPVTDYHTLTTSHPVAIDTFAPPIP